MPFCLSRESRGLSLYAGTFVEGSFLGEARALKQIPIWVSQSVDCVQNQQSAIQSFGVLRMTRCRLLRLGADKSAQIWPGALSVFGGTALLEDVFIEGHTPGFDASAIAPADGWIGTD